MTNDWTATIAAERMQLDQEFTDRVETSSFNRQQWGLVMTALELDIENPADPAQAELVPDTSNVPTIIPELDNVGQHAQMGMGGDSGGSSGGIVDSVKGALGLGGNGDDDRLEEATQLASQYCEQLQAKLESKGRWEEVCNRAQAEQ